MLQKLLRVCCDSPLRFSNFPVASICRRYFNCPSASWVIRPKCWSHLPAPPWTPLKTQGVSQRCTLTCDIRRLLYLFSRAAATDYHEHEGLKTTEMYFLIGLEGGSLKSSVAGPYSLRRSRGGSIPSPSPSFWLFPANFGVLSL